MIYIGTDHRGFELKEKIKNWLFDKKIECFDVGAMEEIKTDDYPDYASMVSRNVATHSEENRGILLCGSGHGMDIVANKFKGIRAVMGFNKNVAIQSRAHENANILILPADWLKPEEAIEIVDIWIHTKFDEAERNQRRLGKIKSIEDESFK